MNIMSTLETDQQVALLTTKRCVEIADHPPLCLIQVTMLNPKFVALQHRWTVQEIFGELSQSVFANIRNSMVAADAFPRTVRAIIPGVDDNHYLHTQVKAELTPDAISDVWTYRLAVHASSALGAVVSALGSTDASISFALSDSSTISHFNSLALSPIAGDVAFGTADAIKAEALVSGVAESEATLTTRQAAYLLEPANTISVLNYERGVPLWIGTARYLGLVQSSGLEDEASPAYQLAYNQVLNDLKVLEKSPDATRVVALGIARHLYGPTGWMTTPGADEYRTKEWAGDQAFLRGGGCDCGSYSTGLYADVAVAISPGLYYYRCSWGLASSLDFHAPWEDDAVVSPMNSSLTKWIIDPDYEDTRNDISIHSDENLVRWWQVYEYCNVSRSGRSPR